MNKAEDALAFSPLHFSRSSKVALRKQMRKKNPGTCCLNVPVGLLQI